MAKNRYGFSDRFPHFGKFLFLALVLSLGISVWSVQKAPTNTQQEAAVPNPTSTPDRLPSNLVQSPYCENSSDKLAGESAAKFSWAGVSGISQYQIFINEYPQIASLPNGWTGKINGTNFQVPTNQFCINLSGKCGLYPGSTIRWTVAPIWPDGTVDQSNWDNVWKSFTAQSCPSPAKLTVNVYLDKNGNGRIDKNDTLFIDATNGYKTTTYLTYDNVSPIHNFVRSKDDITFNSQNSLTYTLLSNTQYYVTTQPPVGYTNSTPYFAVPVYLDTNKTVNILFKPIKLK